MAKKTGPDFHKAAGGGDTNGSSGPLTFVIRTDARHATATIKANLQNYLKQIGSGTGRAPVDNLEARIERVVHSAYRDWGHAMLQALHESIDYSQYDLNAPAPGSLFNADFYNSRDLAAKAVEKGRVLAGGDGENAPPVLYVSLDDLIEAQQPNWGELAFSRLFSIDGNSHQGYRARPGYDPLPEQLEALRDKIDALAASSGEKVSVVLLEDNVRHARMLNWAIDLMEKGGVFNNATLAGISTCFCCAPESEREAIKWRGQTVPLGIVVDYKDEKVDVITPRDLLFDGYVVEIEGEKKRLPAPFMNLSKMFKIAADKSESFHDKVQEANISFCQTIEDEFNVFLPLRWFATADAIAYKTGHGLSTPMIHLLQNPENPPGKNSKPKPGNNSDNQWQNPAP